MAKKSKVDPRQLSLFDDIITTTAEIKRENKVEDNELSSLLYSGNRQTSVQTIEQEKETNLNNKENTHDYSTNSTIRNSTQGIDNGNNRGSIEPTGQNDSSLSNSRQMGFEQSREVDTVGKSRDSELSDPPNQATRSGGHDDELGGIRRHGSDGNEQVGDIFADGAEHRTVAKENYKITAEDNLGKGGIKTKYQNNIDAIKLLNTLRSTGAELATQEEQKVLAKYVGWGGIPQAFDSGNSAWESEYTELKNLINEDDYKNAKRSTQDAHFTSETIINGMYKGLERLGITDTSKELKILEPSAGIGNFIGLKPENINGSFYTVEQDTVSADILKYLYPQSQHKQAGFQNSSFGKGIFDITVGNPPFGNQRLHDNEFPELAKFSIHNYFIAKSVDLLKEGGIGAFVVSRHFMDSQGSSAREHIDKSAHFLGATRLPSTAFKENALADVTTDIVFFQKKTQYEIDNGISKGQDWVGLGEKEVYDNQTDGTKTAYINNYYINNPKQILGKMEYVRGQFADELKCIENEGLNDLSASISNAISVLPANVFDKSLAQKSEEIEKSEVELKILNSDYFANLKEGAFIALKGQRKVVFKGKDKFLNDDLEPVELKNDTAFYRLSGMIDIRDSLRNLMTLEKSEDVEVSELDSARRELNIKYDAFTKKYGFLNSQTNKSLMRNDPESALLLSLEVRYDKGISKEVALRDGKEHRPPSAIKADIFSRRVLEYTALATSAESSLDALMISLRETGKIDFERMSSLLGTPMADIQADLQKDKLIFLNPQSEQWEIKDKYLTGNVKEKLRIASEFAEIDARYHGNVEALKEVIPLDIEAVDIGVKLGSSWIPPNDIVTFIDEKISSIGYKTIDFIPTLGKWEAKIQIYDRTINNEVFGIPQYTADKLIEALLTNKSIKVEKPTGEYDERGKPI